MMNEPQGFNKFYGIVHRHDEIHVYFRSDSHWGARGLDGDYGISKNRDIAISYAISAKKQALFDAKIYVHGFGKSFNKFIITKVK